MIKLEFKPVPGNVLVSFVHLQKQRFEDFSIQYITKWNLKKLLSASGQSTSNVAFLHFNKYQVCHKWNRNTSCWNGTMLHTQNSCHWLNSVRQKNIFLPSLQSQNRANNPNFYKSNWYLLKEGRKQRIKSSSCEQRWECERKKRFYILTESHM